MATPSRISAILECKCPHCRTGHLFRARMYDISNFSKMHSECPVCGQDLRVEPGFYMMASYLHYGFTAIVTIAAVLTDLALGQTLPIWALILSVLFANAILFPAGHRYARVIVLHTLGSIRFDPKAANAQPHLYITRAGNIELGPWKNDAGGGHENA